MILYQYLVPYHTTIQHDAAYSMPIPSTWHPLEEEDCELLTIMFLSPRLKLYTIEFHVSFLARTLLLLCMIGMYQVPGTSTILLYGTSTVQHFNNTLTQKTTTLTCIQYHMNTYCCCLLRFLLLLCFRNHSIIPNSKNNKRSQYCTTT